MSSDEIDTRTKILKASLALFEAQPDALPRMSDIAKAAGVSRQALYLHFDSRTELIVETTRYQDTTQNVEAQFAYARQSTDGRECLDNFVTAWCSYIPKVWSLARPLLQLAATEPEAKAAMDRRLADVRKGFDTVLRNLAADNAFPDRLDVDRAADTVMMLMWFPNWAFLTIEKGWSQDQYIQTMQALSHAILLGEVDALPKALSALDPSQVPP